MPDYRQPGGAGNNDGYSASLPLSAGMGSNLQRPGGPRFRSSEGTRPPPVALPGKTNPVAAPARTTLPTKQHIRCYECAYEFDLTGRMGATHCPKCRASLDLAGYTIDAECRETLKTLGKIKITPRGIVTSAKLLGTDVELAGQVTASSVEATRELVLFPGAEFTRGDFKALDLRLEMGGEATFVHPLLYRNVDVIGALSGPLYATGLVILRASARFTGSIHAGRLIIEDGAIVDAEMNVSPEGLAEADKLRESLVDALPGANERIVVASIASSVPTP